MEKNLDLFERLNLTCDLEESSFVPLPLLAQNSIESFNLLHQSIALRFLLPQPLPQLIIFSQHLGLGSSRFGDRLRGEIFNRFLTRPSSPLLYTLFVRTLHVVFQFDRQNLEVIFGLGDV